MILILMPIEFVVGAIIGFFLCDKQEGLSIDEIKLGSIVFLIANAFVYYQNPEMPGLTIVHLIVSWIMLSIGLIVGEGFRLKIIRNVIQTIHKKDVQLSIANFIQAITRVTYCNINRDNRDLADASAKLDIVYTQLDKLIDKARKLNDQGLTDKFSSIKSLCSYYADYSKYVCSEPDSLKRSEMMHNWVSIGEELSNLSWDTLNHAEENIKIHLQRSFSSNILAVKVK